MRRLPPIVRASLLSAPETLGNWTDGRISYRHSAPISFLVCYVLLPRDARSAKRGIAIVNRPSVCLSVCNVEVPWAYRLDQFEVNYTN